MIIHVDASYEPNRFAISSIVYDNGTAKSFFIPMKFQLEGIWFETNQIIAEMYALYSAIIHTHDTHLTIYTDNQSVSKILNGNANANSEMVAAFIGIIKNACLSRHSGISVCYVPRKGNKKANDISLYMLRSIKKMKTERSNAKDTCKVKMIPINYSLTHCGTLYNIYINSNVGIVMKGFSYNLQAGYCTNCFNGFQFTEVFNWIKSIRR